MGRSKAGEKKKWFAIVRGRRVGVFHEHYETIEPEVRGFSNARYKGFPTEAGARAFLAEETQKRLPLGSPPSAAEAQAWGQVAPSQIPESQEDSPRAQRLGSGSPLRSSRNGNGNGNEMDSLSREQREIVEAALQGKNVFFTGGAGVGKTRTLKVLVSELRRAGKNVGVTASTGIAALAIGGWTVHRYLNCGLFLEDAQTLSNKILYQKDDRARKRIESMDVLVIDEISMLHADAFDIIESVCRNVRGRQHALFGKIQVILCGDFAQLPPVVSREEEQSGKQVEFAFQSQAWQACCFFNFNLERVFRQQGDPAFAELLNRFRFGLVTDEDDRLLASREFLPVPPADLPKLRPRNSSCDEINGRELAALPGFYETVFVAQRFGERLYFGELEKCCSERLALKVGAKVICTRNLSETVVNGTCGVVVGFARSNAATDLFSFIAQRNRPDWVTSFTDDALYPLVRLDDGREVLFTRSAWCIDGITAPLAAVSQVPLILGWAITIHKSQGMSLEQADIDLNVIAPGQAYVALSRVTHLRGLFLSNWNRQKVFADPRVVDFMQHLFVVWGECCRCGLRQAMCRVCRACESVDSVR